MGVYRLNIQQGISERSKPGTKYGLIMKYMQRSELSTHNSIPVDAKKWIWISSLSQTSLSFLLNRTEWVNMSLGYPWFSDRFKTPLYTHTNGRWCLFANAGQPTPHVHYARCGEQFHHHTFVGLLADALSGMFLVAAFGVKTVTWEWNPQMMAEGAMNLFVLTIVETEVTYGGETGVVRWTGK